MLSATSELPDIVLRQRQFLPYTRLGTISLAIRVPLDLVFGQRGGHGSYLPLFPTTVLAYYRIQQLGLSTVAHTVYP
jgi:hypothetical protein